MLKDFRESIKERAALAYDGIKAEAILNDFHANRLPKGLTAAELREISRGQNDAKNDFTFTPLPRSTETEAFLVSQVCEYVATAKITLSDDDDALVEKFRSDPSACTDEEFGRLNVLTDTLHKEYAYLLLKPICEDFPKLTAEDKKQLPVFVEKDCNEEMRLAIACAAYLRYKNAPNQHEYASPYAVGAFSEAADNYFYYTGLVSCGIKNVSEVLDKIKEAAYKVMCFINRQIVNFLPFVITIDAGITILATFGLPGFLLACCVYCTFSERIYSVLKTGVKDLGECCDECAKWLFSKIELCLGKVFRTEETAAESIAWNTLAMNEKNKTVNA